MLSPNVIPSFQWRQPPGGCSGSSPYSLSERVSKPLGARGSRDLVAESSNYAYIEDPHKLMPRLVQEVPSNKLATIATISVELQPSWLWGYRCQRCSLRGYRPILLFHSLTGKAYHCCQDWWKLEVVTFLSDSSWRIARSWFSRAWRSFELTVDTFGDLVPHCILIDDQFEREWRSVGLKATFCWFPGIWLYHDAAVGSPVDRRCFTAFWMLAVHNRWSDSLMSGRLADERRAGKASWWNPLWMRRSALRFVPFHLPTHTLHLFRTICTSKYIGNCAFESRCLSTVAKYVLYLGLTNFM